MTRKTRKEQNEFWAGIDEVLEGNEWVTLIDYQIPNGMRCTPGEGGEVADPTLREEMERRAEEAKKMCQRYGHPHAFTHHPPA